MKELFIVGFVAWLLYQATPPKPLPVSLDPSKTDGEPPFTINMGPTYEDDTPRVFPYPSERSRLGAAREFVHQQPSSSAWAVQTARQFADWVDSIQTRGHPHITGVVRV